MLDQLTSFWLPLLLAVGFLAGVSYYRHWQEKKWKEQSWTGVIIEKESQKQRRGPLVQTRYWIILQTDQGEKVRREVFSERFYNSFQVGDRMEKKKGEDFPQKSTAIE